MNKLIKMITTLINRILIPKSTLPIKKPFVYEYKDELINKLEIDKDVHWIPTAIYALLEDNPEFKQRVANVLRQIVVSLPVDKLSYIDSISRERTSIEWFVDWENQDPMKLLAPGLPQETQSVVLGLSSFHPNGYFREKAVLALAKLSSGEEIPYLIIRLNDWVGKVRDVAKNAVYMRIRPENARMFVRTLPLIKGLEECKRVDHQDFINAIISLLIQPECSAALEEGLCSDDPKVRGFCFEILARTGVYDLKTILNKLQQEPMSSIRIKVFNQIKDKVSLELFDEYAERLLADKMAAIKKIAVEMAYRMLPAKRIQYLERAVLDESSSVREIARFYLDKLASYDFPKYYRDALSNGLDSPGAIGGLGETGQSGDAKIILRFLNHNRTKVRRAAVKALVKLDLASHEQLLISLVSDQNQGVSKEAAIALKGQIKAGSIEDVHHLLKEEFPRYVRKNAANILCSLGRWDAISYILEITTSEDEEISLVGKLALEHWITKFNRGFTQPSAAQKERLKIALSKHGQRLKEDTRKWFEFILQ